MDLRLAGKTVLITGASQGIGEGVAATFAGEGCNLLLTARDEARLTALAQRLRSAHGGRVDICALDLTAAGAPTRLSSHGDVDILVNNAGTTPGGDLFSIDAAAWRQGWELKVHAYIDLCRAVYPAMKAPGGGVIVNNIGASAEYFDSRYIAGCSGNAALVAFTRALGARSLDDGVRVVGISPGPVATDRIGRLINQMAGEPERAAAMLAQFPLGRPASLQEVADAIAFLASPRSGYTRGVVLTVDGGLSCRHTF